MVTDAWAAVIGIAAFGLGVGVGLAIGATLARRLRRYVDTDI
jgi:hypothetical protein